MILAPLRGVTVRCFRETFADELLSCGFTEAFTPFIPSAAGFDPLKDRELKEAGDSAIKVTPQFIGKDPLSLRRSLERVKAAGYDTADLNCGCPFPMVRNKGRGSGLLGTPDVLRRMLEAGCEVMGPGKFSIKTRLGISRSDELLGLMDIVNSFPLRFVTLHARTARQMYDGECDRAAADEVVRASKVPVVENGELDWRRKSGMVGRSFVRHLGEVDNSLELVGRYVESSLKELCGGRAVLGRMKELVQYWKDMPRWRGRWQVAKTARTVDEFMLALK